MIWGGLCIICTEGAEGNKHDKKSFKKKTKNRLNVNLGTVLLNNQILRILTIIVKCT